MEKRSKWFLGRWKKWGVALNGITNKETLRLNGQNLASIVAPHMDVLKPGPWIIISFTAFRKKSWRATIMIEGTDFAAGDIYFCPFSKNKMSLFLNSFVNFDISVRTLSESLGAKPPGGKICKISGDCAGRQSFKFFTLHHDFKFNWRKFRTMLRSALRRIHRFWPKH